MAAKLEHGPVMGQLLCSGGRFIYIDEQRLAVGPKYGKFV